MEAESGQIFQLYASGPYNPDVANDLLAMGIFFFILSCFLFNGFWALFDSFSVPIGPSANPAKVRIPDFRLCSAFVSQLQVFEGFLKTLDPKQFKPEASTVSLRPALVCHEIFTHDNWLVDPLVLLPLCIIFLFVIVVGFWLLGRLPIILQQIKSILLLLCRLTMSRRNVPLKTLLHWVFWWLAWTNARQVTSPAIHCPSVTPLGTFSSTMASWLLRCCRRQGSCWTGL